jgi:hypothetical protein
MKDVGVKLFCDPGSKSAGWALFKGRELLASGTCAAEQTSASESDAFRRLAVIMKKFAALGSYQFEEVFIEQLNTRTHHYTHWAVGAIGGLLAASGAPVRACVNPMSWQKYCGWVKKKKDATSLEDVTCGLEVLRAMQKRGHVSSLDELAAIGMGLYWTNGVHEIMHKGAVNNEAKRTNKSRVAGRIKGKRSRLARSRGRAKAA